MPLAPELEKLLSRPTLRALKRIKADLDKKIGKLVGIETEEAGQ
jgi:hypothetical protein